MQAKNCLFEKIKSKVLQLLGRDQGKGICECEVALFNRMVWVFCKFEFVFI